MIRVQVYCDVCKSQIDVITSAQKVQVAVTGFNDLHAGIDCFAEKEAPNGEGKATADREEGGRNESGAASAGGRVEGGAAPGEGRQRVRGS